MTAAVVAAAAIRLGAPILVSSRWARPHVSVAGPIPPDADECPVKRDPMTDEIHAIKLRPSGGKRTD